MSMDQDHCQYIIQTIKEDYTILELIVNEGGAFDFPTNIPLTKNTKKLKWEWRIADNFITLHIQ